MATPLLFISFSSSSSSSSFFKFRNINKIGNIAPLLQSSSFAITITITRRRRPIIMSIMTKTSIYHQNNNTIKPNNHHNTNNIDTTTTITQEEDDYDDDDDDNKRRRRVLLFDVMDTIVLDPFYQHFPAFFGMSLDELIQCKHPTAWIDFETGLIDEIELGRIFFKDGRTFDLEGLKSCMRKEFSYLQGMEELLHVLKQNNYEMHALTNYPIWYEMIEDKLKLSKYLSWSFCSCSIGKRKPDLALYAEVVRRLDIEPENCIFIDDRARNVKAAGEAGMVALQFKDAKMLQKDLSLLGIQTEFQEYNVES